MLLGGVWIIVWFLRKCRGGSRFEAIKLICSQDKSDTVQHMPLHLMKNCLALERGEACVFHVSW